MPGETKSERKRISIPTADESTLMWWDAQGDPGLSVRLLIRAEIERNGYTDTAFRPVEQQPRRGRPPRFEGDTEGAGEYVQQGPAPVTDPAPVPAPAAPVATAPVPAAAPAAVKPVVAVPAPAPVATPPTPAARPAPAPVAAPVPPAATDGFGIDDLMNS